MKRQMPLLFFYFQRVMIPYSDEPYSNFSVNPESQPNYLKKFHNESSVVTYDSCFGINSQFDGMDHPCIFPFIYRGIVSISSLLLIIQSKIPVHILYIYITSNMRHLFVVREFVVVSHLKIFPL